MHRPHEPRLRLGILCALTAAFVWGATVPFSKRAADLGVPALEAGGLLFAGAALGLGVISLLLGRPLPRLTRVDWRWVVASALCGGVTAPALLVFGQSHTSGMASAVLLALEPPATALFAVALFGERGGRNLAIACVLATGGAVVISQTGGSGGATSLVGAVCVAAAACTWGLDSNLMAQVSRHDPMWLAVAKGGLGALASLLLSLLWRGQLFAPPWTPAAVGELLLVGFVGYGGCLAFITRAFRELGAARAGAIFASAPLFAALASIPVLGERPTPILAVAALLCATGTALIARDAPRP